MAGSPSSVRAGAAATRLAATPAPMASAPAMKRLRALRDSWTASGERLSSGALRMRPDNCGTPVDMSRLRRCRPLAQLLDQVLEAALQSWLPVEIGRHTHADRAAHIRQRRVGDAVEHLRSFPPPLDHTGLVHHVEVTRSVALGQR